MQKQITIIKGLLLGFEIKVEKMVIKLFGPNQIVNCPSGDFQTGENQYWLGMKSGMDIINSKSDEIATIWVGLDFSLADILEMLDKVTEDDYSILCANIALTEIKQEGK